MRTIASTSGSHVTGVTINDYQVKRAKYHNQRVSAAGGPGAWLYPADCCTLLTAVPTAGQRGLPSDLGIWRAQLRSMVLPVICGAATAGQLGIDPAVGSLVSGQCHVSSLHSC